MDWSKTFYETFDSWCNIQPKVVSRKFFVSKIFTLLNHLLWIIILSTHQSDFVITTNSHSYYGKAYRYNMGVNIARLHQQAACKLVIYCFEYNNHIHSEITSYIFMYCFLLEIMRNQMKYSSCIVSFASCFNISSLTFYLSTKGNLCNWINNFRAYNDEQKSMSYSKDMNYRLVFSIIPVYEKQLKYVRKFIGIINSVQRWNFTNEPILLKQIAK